MVMMRKSQLVVFAALMATWSVVSLCAPDHAAAQASISGLVRDSAGVGQIGAVVELMRPDLSVIASVNTDSKGLFVFRSVLPGRYALKAMGTSFLPSLRENVRVRTGTVVNLTLSTLYEVMQWLPAEPRASNAQKDDWKWTLRSAANRPLLRWLEDGPLVVVTDGSGAHPKLKARLMATGQEGTFGESGERISTAVEETPSNSRELLASVDFAPNTDAAMESMLGFRQDLGFAGSVQSVAAVAIHPEIDSGGANRLDEAAIRTWETMNLGDEFEGEVGLTQMLARFGSDGTAANTLAAALPFASVAWRKGDSVVRYRMATMAPGVHHADETEAQAWMPQLSVRNGNLAMEHGLHQEIAWERRTDASGMSFVVFADKIDNPVLEAMGHFAPGDAAADSSAFLVDRASGLLRAAGPGFSNAGFAASADRRLPGGNHIRLSYANGEALALSTAGQPLSLPAANMTAMLAAARPRRAQTYSISLSGTLDGSGTRWRASYSWQPEETVTAVAPYAENAAEPYLNLHLRQPIRLRGEGTSGFEALLDLRNLLAQGYQPYLLSDGSILVFAEDQRGISGGLAFTF
jgi:hypothetical protein